MLLVAACFVPFAWLWAPIGLLNAYGRSLAAMTVFISNYVFMGSSGYFVAIGQENPLLHTWSLAVEEQYYLVFPLLLLMLWRLGRRKLIGALALGAALSFGLAEFYALRGDGDGFYLLPTRAWELLIGALAALTPHDPLAPANRLRQGLSLVGLAAILVSVFTLDPAAAFPSAYALLPTLGAAAILLSATPGTWVHRLLATPPLVGLGLISYSAYLWHQPLFVFARLRYVHDVPAPTIAALISLTLLLATLSWRFVETPFRDRARVSTRRLIWTLAPASLALLAVGSASSSSRICRRRPSCRFATRRWRRSSGGFSPTQACRPPATRAASTSQAAVPNRPGADADGLGRFLRDAPRRRDRSRQSRPRARPGDAQHLRPILGLTQLTAKLDKAFAASCFAFNQAVFDYLATQTQIADVVLASPFSVYLDPASRLATPEGSRAADATFVAERLMATVRAIEALGKRVTIVAPPPASGENIGECLEKATLLDVPVSTCDFSLPPSRPTPPPQPRCCAPSQRTDRLSFGSPTSSAVRTSALPPRAASTSIATPAISRSKARAGSASTQLGAATAPAALRLAPLGPSARPAFHRRAAGLKQPPNPPS